MNRLRPWEKIYYSVIKSGNEIVTPGQKFPLRNTSWIKQ